MEAEIKYKLEFEKDRKKRLDIIKASKNQEGNKLKCNLCFNLFAQRNCQNKNCNQSCEGCVKFHPIDSLYPIYISRDKIEERMKEIKFCSTCAAQELSVDPNFHEIYYREIDIRYKAPVEDKLIFEKRNEPNVRKCPYCYRFFFSRLCNRECRQSCEKCVSRPAADYCPPIYINLAKLEDKMKETNLCSSCSAYELLKDPNYHLFC